MKLGGGVWSNRHVSWNCLQILNVCMRNPGAISRPVVSHLWLQVVHTMQQWCETANVWCTPWTKYTHSVHVFHQWCNTVGDWNIRYALIMFATLHCVFLMKTFSEHVSVRVCTTIYLYQKFINIRPTCIWWIFFKNLRSIGKIWYLPKVFRVSIAY